jgi:hypothetical protein
MEAWILMVMVMWIPGDWGAEAVVLREKKGQSQRRMKGAQDSLEFGCQLKGNVLYIYEALRGCSVARRHELATKELF